MKKRTKVILAVATSIVAIGAIVGWWILDRTIIARMARRDGFDAIQSGDYACAESRLSSAIRKAPASSPDSAIALRFRSIARFNLGRYDDSISDADASLRITPNDNLALTYRGASLYKLGRIDEATKDLEKALQLSPKSVIANYWLGTLAERKGEFRLAYDYYTEATWENKRFAEGFAGLSRVFKAQGDEASAEAYKKIAKEIKPNVNMEID